MALLGQGAQGVAIDYSDVSQSAWQLANANARAFGQVTDDIKGVFEKRKKDKEAVKTGQTKLDAAIELFGDQGGYLSTVRDKIADEDLPISERAALAGTANELLALGIDKMNTDRQFSIQDRGLQLEERRISEGARQFDTGMQAEAYQAQTQQDFANQTALDEGINKMMATQELVNQFGDKLPQMAGLQERFQQAAEAGDGIAAKNVAEEYAAVIRPQVEALTKGQGLKLSTIGTTMPDGRPGEMNVFVDPNGSLYDIKGGKINPDAFLPQDDGPGVLPPRPDVPADYLPPAAAPQLGIRPMVSPNESPSDALAKSRMVAGDARLTETLKGAETLAGTLENLEATEQLLGEVRTGFGAEAAMKAKRLIPGVDVSSAEQLQTLLGDQVMARVAQTKGAVSEKEMALFQEFSANFAKTPEGNKKIVQFAKKAAIRAKKIQAVITDGFATGKTPFEIQAEVLKLQNSEPITDALQPPTTKVDDEDDAASLLRQFGR